jgi:hypothetical protein
MQWESYRRVVLCGLVVLLATVFGSCGVASASILGLIEQDSWSDMPFMDVMDGFNAGTMQLNVTADSSNDLEIGGQFGPSNAGRHYGTGGILGGPFTASLTIAGVVIQPDGTVTSPGSVLVTFGGSAAGSIGDDYGIVAGAPLLTGFVLEVMLNATGDNTLDVLFEITGGALQNINPALGTNFSPIGIGLLRFAGTAMPDSFAENIIFGETTTLDLFGAPIPEASLTTFAFFSGILAWVCGARRFYSVRTTARAQSVLLVDQ